MAPPSSAVMELHRVAVIGGGLCEEVVLGVSVVCLECPWRVSWACVLGEVGL